jgi:hypothetical protein
MKHSSPFISLFFALIKEFNAAMQGIGLMPYPRMVDEDTPYQNEAMRELLPW